MFNVVSNKISFPSTEEEILRYWDDNAVFSKSLNRTKGQKEFVFYDGPPFATGLPHYGHLLAGTIKDIIPRYMTMNGFYVSRRFGWDCHGLPVEMEMQEQLGLKTRQDIEKYGVGQFNEACRSIVLRYTAEWEKTTKRIGRWVDFKNDYKTMNVSFMESVWWVFKTLYEKNLIYEGYKVLPYSWKAGTTLSNFEANLNYKDVQDPAITIKFKCLDQTDTFFLAWTTTPWTLIANLALCVNSDITYVKIRDLKTNEQYILSETRLSQYYSSSEDYSVIQHMKGREVTGMKYVPLFDYAQKKVSAEKIYSVLFDSYVSDQDGTGIVHQAPAYGEDDERVCRANSIPVFDPVDTDGNFLTDITITAGMNIKDADKVIIKNLKERGLIFSHNTTVHSYPFCWRTDTPLIYKATPTWFVKIESLKKNMLKNNSRIKWVPEHIRDGRMGNGIESAPDWNISRNRFWGTPIPIWKAQDGEMLCIGSLQELETLSGKKITDIHKHFVDDVTITKDGKVFNRVPEVLDCWFESGSMPLAQVHYPFENKSDFEKKFPAQFIAEGLDQTRGWFYTLIAVNSALFQREPFQNVIVNGLILAEDGKKMSKRLKNYPAPDFVLDTYGADALRMYMISSAVVKAESLKFSESGVAEILKTIMLPVWNALSFFVSYANIDGWVPGTAEKSLPDNRLDCWILSYLQQLITEVRANMDSYDLQKAVPPIILFIDRLTNWYIRLSRRRFWKSENDTDKNQAYSTLYEVLFTTAHIIAPFMPFIAEKIYSVLKTDKMPVSVHLCAYPFPHKEKFDSSLVHEMDIVEKIVSLGRLLRINNKLKIRQPLQSFNVISRNEEKINYLKTNTELLKDELNVKNILFSDNEKDFVQYSAKINFKKLGKSLGTRIKPVSALVQTLSPDQILNYIQTHKIIFTGEFGSITLGDDDLLITRAGKEGLICATEEDITVVLNTTLTAELINEGIARDIINLIQKKRKDMELEYTARIAVIYSAHADLTAAVSEHIEKIKNETLADLFENNAALQTQEIHTFNGLSFSFEIRQLN